MSTILDRGFLIRAYLCRSFFRPPAKLFDSLVYFGLYMFSVWMRADPVLTASLLQPCTRVD